MNDCESFENRFIDWKQGKLTASEADTLALHAESCSDCRSLSVESAGIIYLLGNQPQFRPANGFELRLEKSIKNIGNNESPIRLKQSVRLFPRFAALGAGLATGLAVGVLLFTAPLNESGNSIQSITTGVDNSQLSEVVAINEDKIVDSLGLKRDSLNEEKSHYVMDNYGKVVSGR